MASSEGIKSTYSTCRKSRSSRRARSRASVSMLGRSAAALAVAGAAGVVLVLFARRRRRQRDVAEKYACFRKAGGDKGPMTVTLTPPTECPAQELEYSVHRPSRLLRRDIELVFRPDIDTSYHSDPRGEQAGRTKEEYLEACLLAVPTWQPAKRDLSEISFEVNQERRTLLDRFDIWAKSVRPRLDGYWSDCSCPMEGNARYGTPTSTIYNELEGLTSLLRYDSIPIGCCGIVLHPKWQRRAYPVTFFTLAPPELLVKAIEEVEKEAAAAQAQAGQVV